MAAKMKHWQRLSLVCTLALMDGSVVVIWYSVHHHYVLNSSLKTENNLEVVKAIPADKILLETGIELYDDPTKLCVFFILQMLRGVR